jgi:hypothetical protein
MEFRWKDSPTEALKRLALSDDLIEDLKAKEAAEGQAERIAQIWTAGIAKDAAEFLLEVLARRDLTVSGPLRDRALSCVDLEQLGGWFEKAAIASSAEDVFSD